MISITGKKWLEQKTNNNSIEKLKQDHNFSNILSKLIVSRDFDQEEIFSIENNLNLNNVFLNNKDFKQSVDLLSDVINKKENICILGDYDVDGSAATSLLVRFFKSLNQPFYFYIPDREQDGYGASRRLFEKLILKKPKLVIMVDCGSTSIEAIDFLNKKKIKSLIIDHHEINKPFPKANVIINPKKDNGYIKYDYLCATTLVYFFLDLLSKKIKCNINLDNFLIYVLLATVCDVMPLRKLNRLIAQNVLKNFNIQNNPAFKEIFNLKNKKNKIDVDDLGYLIGPILNAGGRLRKSNYATELLSTDDLSEINEKSIQLIKLNEKRKQLEKSILDKINFDKIVCLDKNIIIHYDPTINEGLIGIIAARLKDDFNRPSIVITKSNNILKGSCRSIFGYDIGKSIKNSLDENIILNGGGHNMAAGFSLKEENLKKFKKFMSENFLKNGLFINYNFCYDAEISSSAFNKDFFNDIRKLEPFGTGNQLPIFFFKDLEIIKTNIVDNKHILSIFKSKTGFSINSIAFNSIDNEIGKYMLNYKKKLNVVGQIKENIWNNKKTLQLTVKDLIL